MRKCSVRSDGNHVAHESQIRQRFQTRAAPPLTFFQNDALDSSSAGTPRRNG